MDANRRLSLVPPPKRRPSDANPLDELRKRFEESEKVRDESPRRSPRSVLVRLPNWVGDCCLALPLVQALRRQLPGARLVALARTNVAGLAGLFGFDDVIPLDDRGPMWIRPWQLRRAGAKLRARQFDAALTLPSTVSSALLLRMAGIRWTVGFGRGPVRFLLSHPLPFRAARDVHRSIAYLRLLAGLGLEVPDPSWDPPPIDPEARQRAARHVEALAGARHRIGFCIGSVGESRRWPAASYAKLAGRLERELGAAVVLVGGPGDRELAEEVTRQADTRVTDLVGKTLLEEMPALFANLDLVVANDSGGAHLAALALTPTLVFFGAGDPAVTAPLAPATRVLARPVDCAPCLSNTCKANLECMTAITVEDVAAEVRALLGSRADHGR